MPQIIQLEPNSEFNSELLISLVKERPILWDKSLDTYRDKVFKIVAWNEICDILNQRYQQLDKRAQEDYRRSVVCKWTNVRDCWRKCINKQNECTPGRKPVRPYIYHKQLRFLLENGDTDSISIEKFERDSDNGTSEMASDTGEDGNSSNSIQESPSTSKILMKVRRPEKRRRIDSLDSAQMSPAVDCQVNHKKKEEDNRHILFFQSLLPSLASLDDEQILRFQIEVLTLVHTFRKQTQSVVTD